MARYFERMERDPKKEISFVGTKEIYTGGSPGQAARKAATRGHTEIYMRDRKNGKIRQYEGSIEMVKKRSDTKWAEKGQMVRNPKAKYVCVVK